VRALKSLGVCAQMAVPAAYPRVIGTCFAIMLVVYVVMGLAGYLRFGDDSKVLITENLQHSIVGKILSALLVANCACTIAPINAVLGDVFEERLGVEHRCLCCCRS
jgi:hypothetical protein